MRPWVSLIFFHVVTPVILAVHLLGRRWSERHIHACRAASRWHCRGPPGTVQLQYNLLWAAAQLPRRAILTRQRGRFTAGLKQPT